MSESSWNSPADGSDVLFARARVGDQEAWRELFDACYPKVMRVIRRRLNSSALRSLYDSTDFVGDVWTSLAAKHSDFDFPNLAALQAFLATAAERKVIDQYRRLHAEKNDVGRNQPITSGGYGRGDLDPVSHDPTASQVAQATEAREQILSGHSGAERTILELRDEGCDNDDIVQRTGWPLRKLQRFLKDLGDSWTTRGVGSRR